MSELERKEGLWIDVGEVQRVRTEILKLDRRLIHWNGGRGRIRNYRLADDTVGWDIRFVQLMRLTFELFDALDLSVCEYRSDYQRYIDSPEWKAREVQIRRERGFRCERCGGEPDGTAATRLQVHHKTYERLGDELPEDLELLCRSCHAGEHGVAP